MSTLVWSPLWLSAKTALLATLFVFAIGTTLGWMATRKSQKWRILLDAVFTLPLLLPPTVIGFILLWISGQQSAPGRLLNSIGINIVFTWPAAVLASSLVAFPLMYRASRSAFELLDPLYAEAALVMGLNKWQLFTRIQFPLAWPGLAGGLILTFARAMGEFGATMMVAGNIAGRTRTLPLAIYDAVQQGDYSQAATWSLMLCGLSWVAILSINLLKVDR